MTIQPGVVHGKLNRQLAPHDRMFGPDPATGGVTTMGSVVSLDGAGSHWLAYGSARRHVLSLQVVLASGEVIEAGPTPLGENGETSTPARDLARRMGDLVRREQRVIEAHRPQSKVNRCGYQLHDLIEGDSLNLAKLISGSEGTLGLITRATVATVPRPTAQGQALFFFDRLESAASAAVEAAALGIAACDLLDRRLLTLARDADPRYAQVIPREAEAMLLVEVQGGDGDSVREQVAASGAGAAVAITAGVRCPRVVRFGEHRSVSQARPPDRAHALSREGGRAADSIRGGYRRSARIAGRVPHDGCRTRSSSTR